MTDCASPELETFARHERRCEYSGTAPRICWFVYLLTYKRSLSQIFDSTARCQHEGLCQSPQSAKFFVIFREALLFL